MSTPITGRFSHNVGGGTSEQVTCAPGTTVLDLITLRVGKDFDEDDNTVRLNGATCDDLNAALADNFKLSVTPQKADNGSSVRLA